MAKAPLTCCCTNYARRQIYNIYVRIFVIVGGGVSSGVILQRFPEKDWPDTPFIEGIEWVRLLLLEDRFVTSPDLLFTHCVLPYSFVNRKDGPCQRKGKSHASLFRY